MLFDAVLTRRDFVRAGMAAWLLPYANRLAGAREGAWSFAVFSDTHFGIPENLEKNRVMLEEMALFKPELGIEIGDLTERAFSDDYDAVDRGMAGIPYPVKYTPGNHDVRWAPMGLQSFEQRAGVPRQVFEHRGCVFALLDSTVPLSHWGHVGGPERRWLEQELAKYDASKPVFLFLHHAPGRTPSMLDDEDAFGDVLARFNTRIIFTGHGHADLLWQWRGVTCTMGKGLYQGSYQRVEVDPDAGVIRIFRRTAKGLATEPFATVPFRGSQMTPATPRAPELKGALRLAWTQPLGGGVMSHLLLRGDTLYVSAMDGTLQAYSAKKGGLKWRATTGGYCHSSPVLAGKIVLVGSADGSLYAFDAGNGKEKWRFATQGPVYASAAVAKDVAAIASGDGNVYGLELKSGKKRWQYTLPKSQSAFSQSPATSDGEKIYFGAWDKFVYALDAATGNEVWRYQATPGSFAYSAAIGAPALHNGRLYVASNDGNLHAIDTTTGKAAWTRKAPQDKFGYSSATIVGVRIYIGSLGDKGQVHCLNLADGSTVWMRDTGLTIYESSPAVSDGFVAIGSVADTLWLLNAADGSIAGSYRFAPGHFLSSPAMGKKRVFAATLAEQLVALDVVSA